MVQYQWSSGTHLGPDPGVEILKYTQILDQGKCIYLDTKFYFILVTFRYELSSVYRFRVSMKIDESIHHLH